MAEEGRAQGADSPAVARSGWTECPECGCCSLGASIQPDPTLVCDQCRASSPWGAGLDGCPCDPINTTRGPSTAETYKIKVTPEGLAQARRDSMARHGVAAHVTDALRTHAAEQGRRLRAKQRLCGPERPEGA